MARTGQDESSTANKQNAAQKTQAFDAGQAAIGQANTNINKLTTTGSVGVDPWKSADYLSNENRLQSNAIDSATNSAKSAIARQNLATGGLNGSTSMLAQRDIGLQGARLADQLSAERAANDFNNNVAYQQNLATMPLQVAGAESPYYSTATTGQDSALGNLTQFGLASYGPVNSLISSLGSAAGAGMTAFCPAEGSLYLMADGSEKPVESLAVGEQLMAIDDEPEMIEEIQVGVFPAIWVRTANGYRTRNSPTHAFVLPKGGFVVAARSLGKSLLTQDGASEVVSIEPAGMVRVFNVITNRTHSYRADGVWALGVGDAERHVSMAEWQQIGEQLFKNSLELEGA